jgi:hypothetical protein
MNHISSPDMSDQGMERVIVASGNAAPRVTPAELDANIVHTEILKHVSHSGQVLRWAILTTRNGFAVTGKPSAAVSAENDDVRIGEKVALDNARNELWPLMGYELKQRLHQVASAAGGLDLTSDKPLGDGNGCSGGTCEACQ